MPVNLDLLQMLQETFTGLKIAYHIKEKTQRGTEEKPQVFIFFPEILAELLGLSQGNNDKSIVSNPTPNSDIHPIRSSKNHCIHFWNSTSRLFKDSRSKKRYLSQGEIPWRRK